MGSGLLGYDTGGDSGGGEGSDQGDEHLGAGHRILQDGQHVSRQERLSEIRAFQKDKEDTGHSTWWSTKYTRLMPCQ